MDISKRMTIAINRTLGEDEKDEILLEAIFEITLLREFARVLLDDDYLRASAMVAKHPTLANLGSASVLDKS